MKISLNWLKQYIDLNDLSVDDVVNGLITAGLEVDEMVNQTELYKNFVVGFVKEKKKHPNADKLSLCIINDGVADYSVVCGAPNVDKNQKIVFAKIGAVIPEGGFEIKPVKLRGEKSEGMICSERELSISDNHDGIMVLDASLKEGTDISEALKMNDVIFDIDITPNRADALSHFGVARDLSAVLNRSLIEPELKFTEENKKSSDYADIIIENEVDCPRYAAKVVTGVEIKESPEWLKTRLKSLGLRPINNVVDVTNFVLHELGQPLHAFDLDQLAGNKIVVKSAVNKEKFVTLDSKERELSADDLLICDGEKGVAIAGVMGGENSEVTVNTKNILIESAYFRPSAVRKTAKKLGLSTDASYRFERGCNPDIVVFAARRCAMLIAELGGGNIASGEIDVYPKEIVKKNVTLRFSRISKILGYSIANEQVENILVKLGINVLNKDLETLFCEIPLFRPDIEREIDLIEEIARVYGYDNIPSVSKISITLDPKTDQSGFSEKIRYSLASLGFREIITNSLLNEETAKKFGNAINILNPQSYEMANTRPSLLPGMLSTFSKNIKVREHNLKYFEVGHIFEKKSEGEIKSFDDIFENEFLLMGITGKSDEDQWYTKTKNYDIYDLRGNVEDFLSKNLLDKDSRYEYNQQNNSFFDQYFELFVRDVHVGFGGKVKTNIAELFDIKQDVFAFNINLDVLKQVESKEKRFTELLKYPKIIRDFAIVLDKSVEYGQVVKSIFAINSKLLKNVKLFDIFESESLGEDKKSMAFQLEFYDENRTLTEEEVNKDFWNAIEIVKKDFNAQLRG
ncbi:MAG: phenylalanine--tRNA ligase subunit beta [Ignavibacteriae bacterium HGW-Ignavibacteriae-2]|nr:MAG: phenylalanine--tRNA ligase subunit beta [Ignavibacteriae bacterium HGW-Ignavibacteriae-2]